MHGTIVGSSLTTRRASGPRLPGQRRAIYSSSELAAGVDSQGRFIGRNDVDRGVNYFLASRGRASLAPLMRTSGFSNPNRSGGRPCGLDFAKLREIHRLRHVDKLSIPEIAAKFSITFAMVYHHLTPSASMRAALAPQS